MSIDTAMDRLRAANPAPDTRLLRDDSDDLNALLATTWQRSTNVQTHQQQKVRPERSPQRRGWLTAVAVFAVIVVVGAVVVSLRSGNDIAPSTPPTETTTDTETTGFSTPPFETPRAAAESWVFAIETGSAEEIHGLMAENYTGFQIIGSTIAETDERIRYARAIGVRHELLDSCEESSPTSITCEIAITMPPSELLRGNSTFVDAITVRIDDAGYVSSTSLRPGPEDDCCEFDLTLEFEEWLATNGAAPWSEIDPSFDSIGQLDMEPEEAADVFMAELRRFIDSRES